MRNNILTLLVGFLVMLGSVMLFKLGLDKMTDANAATSDNFARVDVDLNRRAILYRVAPGDTLWNLAERFYGEGRRWEEIAGANNLDAGEGLVSGAIIKIPLTANEEEQPSPDPAEVETLGYDEVEKAISPGRFGLGDETIKAIFCKPGHEAFPAGALCVARDSEQQSVRIALFDATQSGEASPLATWEAPAGDTLRELISTDIDGDGVQDIYTIWSTPNDPNTSRVLKWDGDRIVLVSETPDDPMAILRLRARK